MIFSAISQSLRYAALHPLFPRAFDYLCNTDLSALSVGVHSIVERELFVIVEAADGCTKSAAQLEVHRRYIDIQLVLEGDEQMGWKPLLDCFSPVAEYNAERDIQFFHDAPASWVAVPAQHFCIFFPEDAHAPLLGSGKIRKVIVKVAV